MNVVHDKLLELVFALITTIVLTLLLLLDIVKCELKMIIDIN